MTKAIAKAQPTPALADCQSQPDSRQLRVDKVGVRGLLHPIEVRDLAQLDTAFDRVAGRREPVEGFHFGVNSLVTNATFALYRDFPDPVRHAGEEKF